jgi:hypothetical protein
MPEAERRHVLSSPSHEANHFHSPGILLERVLFPSDFGASLRDRFPIGLKMESGFPRFLPSSGRTQRMIGLA